MPVDISQALDLRYNRHLSYRQIASIQGVSPQAIHQKIKDLLPIPETQVYIDHRADILAHTQLRLLAHLDGKKIKEMPGRDLVVATGILYDKERLERGQSTANVEMHTLSQREVELQERLDQLKQAKLSTGRENLPKGQKDE